MIIDAGLKISHFSTKTQSENLFLSRIYSAFIKIVDGQPKTSNWGAIKNTGELLYEFQSGLFYCVINFLKKLDFI